MDHKRRNRTTKFFGVVTAALLTLSTAARCDYLPSIKIGTAALISPSSADTYYGQWPNTSSDGLSAYTHAATPVAPEIVELARALKNDPDLIYQYVHNNIQTVWMYGLQKGALGTEIDKAGTPFDQAELMIALLRQAGYSTSYIASTIVLNKSQFSNWAGITNARAACQMLSGGGIPAVINGKTDAACSDTGFNGNVTTVQMAHIWVKVTIGGADYVFDPSYKTLTWKSGIDLAGAMAFGDPLHDATTGGGYVSGTLSGVPYARSLNTGALNGDLQNYASSLLSFIQANNLQGAQIEDIVGGGVIMSDYTVVRQTSLPYADPAPPYTRVWTPSTRYNAIPDQYRTTLTIDAWEDQYDSNYKLFWVRMFAHNNAAPTFFSDEIYGRRLTIETNFTPQGIGVDHQEYLVQRACLALDSTPWSTWNATTRPSFCIGTGTDQLAYDYDPGTVEARDLPTHIILTADHPYAAANGTYMDATVDKNVRLITPLTIVHAWGDVNPAMFNKWSEERASDNGAAIYIDKVPCGGGGEDSCNPIYTPSAGDFSREKLAASWLAQMTRAAQLNTAISNSVSQIHHVLGFVYGDATVQGVPLLGVGKPSSYTLGDNYDRVDVDTGISWTSRSADQSARNAGLLAFAATSATLEGSMAGQMADVPDTASTATRFEWGNSPDPDTGWHGQNPYQIQAQDFYQYTTTGKASALTTVDAGGLVPGACTFGGVTLPAGDPPQFSSGQCSNMAGVVAATIDAYVGNGFSVVASKEAYLGPGQRGGTIYPIVDQQGHTTGYTFDYSKQRGGAFVAVKYSGIDPVEIAHIITGPLLMDQVGGVGTKGGGAGSEPDSKTTYDPATAADILKSRFVDRSSLYGVNLSNGSLSYTSPVSLTIGNSGFPYALTASLSWHPAPPNTQFGPVSPIAPPPGWVHSWQNSTSLSGSGLEAMGQSDIRAAAGAIVAFYAAQSIYKTAAALPRDVAAVLTLSWWSHQLSGNVATVNIGGNARQFVKLANGAWIAPGAGFATFAQTGSRIPYEEKCFYRYADKQPYALTRGWDSTGIYFTVTNAHGDAQRFDYFDNPYYTDADIHICGHLKGFRLTSWTFPYGMTVTPTYTPTVSGVDVFDFLTDVHNSLSPARILTFTTAPGTQTIGNNLAGSDSRAISFSQPVQNASTVWDQLQHTTNFQYVGPFGATSSQRPVPYVLLSRIQTPNDTQHFNTEYDYDSLGRVYQVMDAQALYDGTRGPYQFYLADGTRGERDDPLGQTYTVGYDTYGHPSRYIDELLHETDALFDSRGRVIQYVYPEGDCELFGYDDNNNTTSYQRIDKVSLCNPNAGSAHVLTVTATYNQDWNKPNQITNARNFITNLNYYAGGAGASLLETATRPAIAEGTPVYSFDYTPIGKLNSATVRVTATTNIVTQNNYDANTGNLTSTVLDPGTAPHLHLTTSFGYDAQGDVTLTTDPRLIATNSCFDLARRKTEDDHHDGQLAAFLAAEKTIYDAIGRDIEEDRATAFSNPQQCTGAGVTWQMNKITAYTPTSKVYQITDADSKTTTTTYDGDDRVQAVADPAGRTTYFTYCNPLLPNCAANQVKAEIRAWASGANCTNLGFLQQCYRRLTYGADGEQATIEDADNNITSYNYDDFNRLTKTIFPDSSFEKLTLDENGNVTQRRNRASETLTYQYNALDWVTQKTSPNPAVTDYWTYLLNGRIDTLCESTDCSSGNKIDNNYDTAGRLTQVITHIQGFSVDRGIAYTLDADGNRTNLQWPQADGAYAVGYCYDNLNRMTVAMENSTDPNCATNVLAHYYYDPLSRRTNLVYHEGNANTDKVGYIYSAAGDLLNLDHNLAAAANSPHYTFTYTDAHELQTESNNKSAYVWQPSTTGTTSYAAANNLNQYPSYNPGSVSRPLGYDPKGNLTSGNLDGSGIWAFGYDAENRMTSACKPVVSGVCSSPTMNAAYAYDPLGRRTHKSGTGVTERYVLNDGDDEVVEYDGSKNPVAFYIPGPAIDEPVAMSVPNGSGGYTHEYFHANHQGSVISMSDDTGGLAEGPFLYDAYGNCFKGSTACGSLAGSVPYKFTGRRLDPETGLYYYRARMYSSGLGRFAQTDPVGYTADLNLYTYVGNDPVNFRDALGLYNCDTTNNQTQCGNFESSRQNAEDALKKMDPSSKAAKRLAEGLKKLGTLNDKNNVNVKFSSEYSSGEGGANISNGKITVTLSSNFGEKSSDPAGNPTAEGAGIVAHEGAIHVLQLSRQGMPKSEQQDWDMESEAYNVQSFVEKALGNPSGGLWQPGWPSNQAETNRRAGVLQGTQLSVGDWCREGNRCNSSTLNKRIP